MDRTHQRRLLAGLVIATLALLGADLAGSGRGRGRAERRRHRRSGPVQRALSGAPRDEIAALEAAERPAPRHGRRPAAPPRRAGAPRRAARRRHRREGHRLVAARVVASDLSPLGGRSLTLDVGARDGVTVDSTVVTAEGLAGRVVAVSPWTSDVQVLGSTGLGHRRAGRPGGHPRDGELAVVDRPRVAAARIAHPVLRAAGHPRRRRRRAHARQRRRPPVCRGHRRRHRDRRRPRPWAADPHRDGAPRRRPRRHRGRRRARAADPGRDAPRGARTGHVRDRPSTPRAAAPAKAAGS